jgi:polysaccharide biosynthesis protein PslH
MRILIVATKSPWPPCDGGRLVLWWTMQGLAAAGHQLALVAPRGDDDAASHATTRANLATVCTPELITVRRRGFISGLLAAWKTRRSLSVARHAHPELRAATHAMHARFRPDVVHVEQLQALTHTADLHDTPVILRMQNVESSLWRQIARARWFALPLRFEARRVARDEQRALRTVDRMLTLSARDAEALNRGNQSTQPRALPLAPACPLHLPTRTRLAGTPAVTLVASSGWWPNEDATRWFLTSVWPLLLRQCPGALLHVFGGTPLQRAGVHCHRAPVDAIDAFPEGAIVVVPLRIGSGIRMRILEAFARGLPVVASSVAAAGLDVQHGRELLIADGAADFAAAIATLCDSGLRTRLVAAGRDYLLRAHDPALQSAALLETFRDCIAARAPP